MLRKLLTATDAEKEIGDGGGTRVQTTTLSGGIRSWREGLGESGQGFREMSEEIWWREKLRMIIRSIVGDIARGHR